MSGKDSTTELAQTVASAIGQGFSTAGAALGQIAGAGIQTAINLNSSFNTAMAGIPVSPSAPEPPIVAPSPSICTGMKI